MVSLAAARASTVARMGPIQGVQPKANAKPRKKPLQTPGCVDLLRRWTSRLSQRAMAGPKKPMSESEKNAILAEEGTDGAGRGSEGNEHHRKAGDKSEGGREKAGGWHVALAELLHADAGEHGDVAGHQRQNARREEGNQPREDGPC